MWQILLLALLAASATGQGFLFPDEAVELEGADVSPGNDTSPTEAPDQGVIPVETEQIEDDYGDYGPTVDPGEEGIEERFFFGKKVSAGIGRKLGQAASSFLNTLSFSGDDSPVPPVVQSPPGYGAAPPYHAASPYGTAPRHPGAPGYIGGQSYPPGPVHEGDTNYPDYDTTSGQPGALGYEDAQSYGGRQGYEDFLAHAGVPGYGGIEDQSGYTSGYESSPGYRAQDYGDSRNSVAGYGDYEPQPAPDSRFRPQSSTELGFRHQFPVDKFGRIQCGRVPRRQKKACRTARRQQRRGGGGGVPLEQPTTTMSTTTTTTTTPEPFICPSAPDAATLAEARQKCCGLQQRDDLYGFNNCCQTLGFCPICEVDIEKLAEKECCPIQHEGDTLGFRRCCSRFGTCPECGPAPTQEPEGPVGCIYKGKLFPVGEVMERIAYKCMFVNCRDNGAGPETVLEYLPKVGCCEMKGKSLLYPPGHTMPKDDCTNLVCEDGEWVPKATDAAAIFERPCPDGWLDLGGSCVFIWRELMTFGNATIACGKLRGSLALLQNSAQLTQLINAFRDMEGRDSSRELGGWVNAQFADGQWQTLQGDTLAFAPWEEGYPDNLRRTNCAGLTVTERSQGWKDYMCDNRANMLYPICQVAKPDCGELSGGCGPYDGDMMFAPGTEVSIFSNKCERFMCNEDSYVVRQVNRQCCYHHEWNGRARGRSRGWYTGLFPPGGFEMFEGMLCECTNGVSDCQQFFE